MLLQRLRDISQQDKNELQHTAKELEKLTTELTTAQQRNESLKEELAKAEDTIDELKEQVKIPNRICAGSLYNVWENH